MKIITADKKITDGTMHRVLQHIDTDIPILLLSRVDELDFNEEILTLEGKKFVVVDVIEQGWNVEIKETLILGVNKADFMKGEGWVRLSDFLCRNEPILYLKRELLVNGVSDKVLPLEYPNFSKPFEVETKEQFNGRPLSIFNYWGRSHEARLLQHGMFWVNAARKGYAVCDNIYYFNNFMAEEKNPNKWITFHIPHYARIDISEILNINGMSKLALSLPGCGIKCFRSTEVIANSIMVMPEDNLAYSYPFEHSKNCIRFTIESVDGISKEWKVCEAIEEALKRDDLYEIYLGSLEAAKFYQVDTYIPYLENLINKYL
jgi:hypothetical protein